MSHHIAVRPPNTMLRAHLVLGFRRMRDAGDLAVRDSRGGSHRRRFGRGSPGGGSARGVLCTLVMHHLPEDGRRQALAEMRRVLRPEGRLLVVDIAEGRGVWAALNPVLLLHGHDARHVLPESEEALRKTGFRDVAAGPLGFGILGFTLGRAKACDA